MGYAHTMKSGRHIARLTAATLLLVGAGAIVAPGGTTPVQAAACTTPGGLCGGGEFHPLTPVRIFDSRPSLTINDVNPIGAKPLGAPPVTFDIGLLGLGGLPASLPDVLAVVVNITVTEPGASGYLEAYGTGARPAVRTSIVNFAPNQTVPNVAIVRPGPDGKLTIGLFGQSGTAQVLVDVFGWFSTSDSGEVASTGGARLIPTKPSRVLDTRDGTGTAGNAVGPLNAGTTIDLPIRGIDGVNPPVTDVVPDSQNVTGVLLNVVGITARPGGTSTYLSLVPDPLPSGQNPTTSNVNLTAGVIKANLVFVPVNLLDGKVRIFNFHGSTDVVADVVGYMLSGQDPLTRKGRVVPLSSPYRTFDTREANFGSAPLGPGQAEDWSFAEFANSVFIGADSVGNQLAVIGNITAAELKPQYANQPASSFLTAYPAETAAQLSAGQKAVRPLSSNLNTTEGPPVPNMAVLTYGDKAVVRVYNLAGYQHYLFDASAVILDNQAP